MKQMRQRRSEKLTQLSSMILLARLSNSLTLRMQRPEKESRRRGRRSVQQRAKLLMNGKLIEHARRRRRTVKKLYNYPKEA